VYRPRIVTRRQQPDSGSENGRTAVVRNRLCRGRLSLLVKLIDSVAAEDPDRSSISIPRNDHLQRIS